MPFTYDDDEKSVSDARPVELYTIITPTTTYYLTSYSQDIVFGGNTYSAATINRGTIEVPAIGRENQGRQLEVHVSLDHALAQDLLVGGIPQAPSTVQVDVLMQRSGIAQTYFLGTIASAFTDGNVMKLAVSGKIDQKMATSLPIAVSQRVCQHGLGDAGCTINLANVLYNVVTAVIAISSDGFSITVNSLGQPDQWAQYGKITRNADGEPRSIVSQVGNVLAVDAPFRTLGLGNAVTVVAGCDHAMATCRSKFSNRVNYGGNPLLPTRNIATPRRLGLLRTS